MDGYFNTIPRQDYCIFLASQILHFDTYSPFLLTRISTKSFKKLEKKVFFLSFYLFSGKFMPMFVLKANYLFLQRCLHWEEKVGIFSPKYPIFLQNYLFFGWKSLTLRTNPALICCKMRFFPDGNFRV